jgi:hypothetical protein
MTDSPATGLRMVPPRQSLFTHIVHAGRPGDPAQTGHNRLTYLYGPRPAGSGPEQWCNRAEQAASERAFYGVVASEQLAVGRRWFVDKVG